METHSGWLYLESYSVDHFPKLRDIDEGWSTDLDQSVVNQCIVHNSHIFHNKSSIKRLHHDGLEPLSVTGKLYP